jgi:DNA (cytosine-5)-methyltransferase 1
VIALDCCAGAGGLSLGLHRAGFDVLGVEWDADACETHRRNVGPCELASLWDYSPTERYELVAGGIPCQSHSMAGKRGGTCDPRGQLYVPFLRIAREAGARAVLIENVRGMLTSPSATHGTALLEIVDAVRAAGFAHTTASVLNAADYGVPQKRHRLFIVGFVDAADLARFAWPVATHAETPDLFGLRRWVSVRDALGLPPGQLRMVRDSGAGAEREPRSVDEPSFTIRAGASGRAPGGVRLLDQPAPCVTATEYKSANTFGSEGAKTGPRRCGDQLNPLLTELARAGVLDRPSTTVDATNRLSAAGHHTTNKAGAVRLTVAQLAVLQSFPPDFEFVGTKKAQHRQVGNAVPPPLAEAVGRAVFAALASCSVAANTNAQRGAA